MIEVSDLTILKDSKVLVDHVDFNIGPGEVLGIVGESGSGKSLTALALIDLLPPLLKMTSGTKLLFKGNEITNISGYRGNKVAMIFQEPMNALNPTMKVVNQIIEAVLECQNMTLSKAVAKTEALLKKVSLNTVADIANRYPHQLSGGQKQRVMIAIALSRNPDLIIADEATTALDVTVQKEIIELLKEIIKEGNQSVLFISHDLKVVRMLADRCLVMRKGKIEEQGTVKDIFSFPKEGYTKALIACRPDLQKRPKRLASVEDYLTGSYSPEMESTMDRQARQRNIYSQKPILELHQIGLSYPETAKRWMRKTRSNQILQNITFKLFEGESLGLIGESGCGKTTLGKIIVQQINATKGSVFYNKERGIDSTKLSDSIQVVFQDPFGSLNPRRSIGEAIKEVFLTRGTARYKSIDEDKVKNLLVKVGLSAKDYRKYPYEFSGGQRQRIAIARALAAEPKILICDEAVSALDVSVQAQVLNLLKKLQEEMGLTYLFISHDLSVVKYFCDRIIVLNKNGEIEEEGESDLLYHYPKSLYTQKLIAAVPQ